MTTLDAGALRRMLIIGSDLADAYAFVGSTPDAPPGSAVADQRPSLLVPENMWPTGEAFNCSLMSAYKAPGVPGWPTRDDGQPPIDALIVTRAALAVYGATVDDVRAWAGGLLNPDGGWLYVQPSEAA